MTTGTEPRIDSNMKKTIFPFLLLCLTGQCFTQDLGAYEKHVLVQGPDSLPYRVLMPLNYDSSKKYPVVFFLHGAGERGGDNESQLIHGARLFLQEDLRKKYPAIVIFPQCPRPDYWSNVLRDHGPGSRDFIFLPGGTPTRAMEMLQQLVGLVLNAYPVKKDQVYAGGLSMGGMGTFELVRRTPGVFAAAFPICGGAHPATAAAMKNLDWWVFHGAKDDVVPPQHSRMMVDALKAAGAPVKFTLYPEANHNSWDSAFAEPELFAWLFSKRKKQ